MAVIGIIIYISFSIMSIVAFFWVGRKFDVGKEDGTIYGLTAAVFVVIHIVFLYLLFNFFRT